jgi:hypothetical protein
MSRDKRGVVNPVVGASSPPATAKASRRPPFRRQPFDLRRDKRLWQNISGGCSDPAEVQRVRSMEQIRLSTTNLFYSLPCAPSG